MKITVIGRGNVGGGLAELWRGAGHEVTELGSDGGDVSNADVVLLAVPFDAVADALGKVSGLEGKVVIDATNRIGTGPPEGFSSGAEHGSSTTYDIALTPDAIANAEGGQLSLAIDSTGGDAFYIATRETATPPQLVITTG